MARPKREKVDYAAITAGREPLLPKLLTVDDLAESTKISKCTILRFCREGRIFGAQKLRSCDWVFHPDWQLLSDSIEAKLGGGRVIPARN